MQDLKNIKAKILRHYNNPFGAKNEAGDTLGDIGELLELFQWTEKADIGQQSEGNNPAHLSGISKH